MNLLLKLEALKACQRCRATTSPTWLYCVDCRKGVCWGCGGIHIPHSARTVRCVHCLSQDALQRGKAFASPSHETSRREMSVVLAASTNYLQALKVRGSTHKNHATGVRQYLKYAKELNLDPFPATPKDLMNFLSYEILILENQGSTASDYLNGVHDLHQTLLNLGLITINPVDHPAVKEMRSTVSRNIRTAYKAKRPLEFELLFALLEGTRDPKSLNDQHLRMHLILIGVGMIRPGAASIIEVHYTLDSSGVTFLPRSHIHIRTNADGTGRHLYIEVHADKNRNPSLPIREVFIPEHIGALELHPIQDVLNYLIRFKPNSANHFLTAGPRTNGTWASYKPDKYKIVNGYKPNKDLRFYALKLLPNPTKEFLAGFTATSLRKTLTQTLTDDGWPEAVICDVGGWARPKIILNSYATTPPHIRLLVLTSLTQSLGPRYYASN